MNAGSGRDETRAAALSYARGEAGAPRVVAKGRGFVAERILALARENGVPVHRDRDLVELLACCDLGDEIPAEVFGVVAELVAYAWRVNASMAPSDAPADPR